MADRSKKWRLASGIFGLLISGLLCVVDAGHSHEHHHMHHPLFHVANTDFSNGKSSNQSNYVDDAENSHGNNSHKLVEMVRILSISSEYRGNKSS